MAVQGPRGTFNQATITTRVSMDEAIELLDKFDTVLSDALASEPIDNIRNDWLDDDLDPQTVVATGPRATNDIPVVDSSNIRVRDLLRLVPNATVDSPTGVFEVTAVPNATTITVAATNWAGTTGDTLANGYVLEVIGQVPQEGADPQPSRDGDPSGRFNYTSIFQEKVDATRTAQKNTQYGIDDPMARMEMRKLKELAIRFERALISSVRHISADKKQRTFGGLLYFITTNVRTATQATIETVTGDALEAAFSLGARPDVLYMGPKSKRLFSNLNEDRIQEARDERGIGQVKTFYESDFGRLELVTVRNMPNSKLIALDRQYVKKQVFDDWFREDLAKTGDSDQAHIVGEFSLKVKNEKAHGVITITDYP